MAQSRDFFSGGADFGGFDPSQNPLFRDGKILKKIQNFFQKIKNFFVPGTSFSNWFHPHNEILASKNFGQKFNTRMEPIGERRSRHEKNRDFLKKFLKFFLEFFRREKADIEIAQIGQNRPNQKNFLGFEPIRKKNS